MEKVEAKKICKEHMHRYVCVQMQDGSHYDGIMENVDDDMIYLAVPVGLEAAMHQANWSELSNSTCAWILSRLRLSYAISLLWLRA